MLVSKSNPEFTCFVFHGHPTPLTSTVWKFASSTLANSTQPFVSSANSKRPTLTLMKSGPKALNLTGPVFPVSLFHGGIHILSSKMSFRREMTQIRHEFCIEVKMKTFFFFNSLINLKDIELTKKFIVSSVRLYGKTQTFWTT